MLRWRQRRILRREQNAHFPEQLLGEAPFHEIYAVPKMVVRMYATLPVLFVTSTACAGLPKARTVTYGAVVGVLPTVLQMIESGDRVKGSTYAVSHVPRRRHRPRDRVVSQSALGGLQDRRRHRARAARAIPSARGGARGDGRCRLADDRARSR